MPRNVYAEIYLHLVWHTKHNVPSITETIEEQLYRYVRNRAMKTPEVMVQAIGGTANHVHLAVSVPPTLTVSEWIGAIKGASAHYINHEIANRKILEWQTGYGVVSFGKKDLPWVVKYIQNQKEHHAKQNVFLRLERIDRDNEG